MMWRATFGPRALCLTPVFYTLSQAMLNNVVQKELRYMSIVHLKLTDINETAADVLHALPPCFFPLFNV